MNPILTNERQWTIEQIAEHAHVDVSTVRRWTRRRVNRLKTLRYGYRTVRVLDGEYNRFLNNQAA